MKRRNFIKTTGLVGMGLAIGLSGTASGRMIPQTMNTSSGNTFAGFIYPRGGCTESGLALFDRGPRGKDPFGLDR